MLKDQRGVVHLLVPLILLAGIVVGVYLIKTGNLKLFPKATNPPIVFKSSTGQTLPTNSSGIPQTTSPTIKIELTSTLGPPATSYTYPTPYSYPTPSYGTPTYGTPSYGTPSYGTPSYGTPSYIYPTPITPPSPTPSPTPIAMRVFVTSTNYNGNLGGLSGADQKCQDRANAANLGGTWKAWLSDSRTSASSRLNHYNGPYKNLQNSILLANWADLIDGSDGPRINVDEFKSTKTRYAWTNTNFKGDLIATTNTIGGANGHCADWVSTTPTITGGVGSIDNNSYNTQWTSITVIACTQQASLYCFEQTTSGVQGVESSSYSTPSYLTPSSGGVSQPITTGTVSYKIAENPTDLTNKTAVPYTAQPTTLDYTFQDSSLGQKFIWVEFIGSNGTTDRRSAQIELVAPTTTSSPTPSPIPSSPLTLTANPSTLTGSGQVVLSWNISGNTTSCSLSRVAGGLSISGSWNGTIRGAEVTSGTHSRTVTLTSASSVLRTTTFNIACRIDNVDRSASATVTVNPQSKPSVTLSANPISINSGSSVTLTWDISGGTATTCSLTNSGNARITSGSWSGTLRGADITAGSYSRSISLSRPTAGSARTRTFSISCANTGGRSQTSSVTMTVR